MDKEDGRAGAQGLTRESEVCNISLEERESGWVGNIALWPAIIKGPPEVNAQDFKFQSTWRCIFSPAVLSCRCPGTGGAGVGDKLGLTMVFTSSGLEGG